MTAIRVAAFGAIALAALVLVLVFFRASDTRPYVLYFQTAGQLVPGNDVQVAGRRVGYVDEISLTPDNQARIDVRVEAPYAPLREGTKGVIRATSLSGIANRYVALTPGPDAARELPDGAVLRQDATTSIVDLDQLFATFDARTRRSLRRVIRGFSEQYDGRSAEANATAEAFNPLLSTSRRLFDQLGRDEEALTAFLVNTGRAMTALADRRDNLSQLVANANVTARAIAAEDAALTRALRLLPTTLRRANTTFVNLRATLDDLDVLVDASKPATRRLAPFLRELRPLVEEARPTIRDLRALVRRPGAANDALEATRELPLLRSAATPAFAQGRRALGDAQPLLESLRPYTPDLVGWIRDFGQGAAAYDANGHYARVQPMFNSFRFAESPEGGTLTPQPLDERLAALERGNLLRCPGAATQPASDGSSPWPDGSSVPAGDCDPAQVPPGGR